MPFPFIQENTDSRTKLEGVVHGLSDTDLTRANAAGWTVAALLVHLAFYDRRALVLLRRWKASGLDESPIDADAMNDALLPIFLDLDPHKAAELCLSSAAAVDAELETVTPELFYQIEAAPTHYRFSRAEHRNDHLNDIANILSSPPPAAGS
jgi:DinB superfamily